MAEKKGLGRGLSSLLSETPKSKKTEAPAEEKAAVEELMAGMRELPIEFLTANPKQPRQHFDEDKLQELAGSIKQRGVLQPILVRPTATKNTYEIVAGERRWRAAQLARLDKLPVIIADLSDQETFEIAIIENVQRADLSATEEAQGFRRLMDEFGYTQEALSKVIGKSRVHIANTLRLLDLPARVRQMVEEGLLSAGHARALVGRDDAVDIAAMIIEEGMSVRAAENYVRDAKRGVAPKGGKKSAQGQTADKDADIRALERELEATLGLRISINHQSGEESGTVTITYKTLEQFDDLLARFRYVP
ncbi:MAG: ParB/RepB/Spo0J family partition protein [Alphaproteobacteria bacterium]